MRLIHRRESVDWGVVIRRLSDRRRATEPPITDLTKLEGHARASDDLVASTVAYAPIDGDTRTPPTTGLLRRVRE